MPEPGHLATRRGIFLARPERAAEGIPLAVKDLFDTAGLTTTYGSAIFRDHVPAETATAVRRLEAAGYANVGKTNLHEFAYGITSVNPHYGTVPNPRCPGSHGRRLERRLRGRRRGRARRWSASAATPAARSASRPRAAALVGFKPTFGLVPMDGCFPLAPSFDHAGPIAAIGGGLRRSDGRARARARAGRRRLSPTSASASPGSSTPTRSCARVSSEAAALLGARRVELPLPEVGAGVRARGRGRAPRSVRRARGRVRRQCARQDRALPRAPRRGVRARAGLPRGVPRALQ